MSVVQRDLAKDRRFRLWSDAPINGEPPPELLARELLTPTELFYVRCHGPVPAIDEQRHRLVVDGLVEQRLELATDDLRAEFPRVRTLATLHCAGNRRAELSEIAPIPDETPWRQGAIGNAHWSGVRLRDVLTAAGVREGASHVELVGCDEAAERDGRHCFGGSSPLSRALAPETLLALEMNGAPLAPAHGFPLRAVVPGYIGARSVKWLERVTVLAGPSQNPFQARSYKLFPPTVRAADADWEATPALGEAPLSSAICTPAGGASIRAGAVAVAGWACAGGDRVVDRVEVGDSGGAAWQPADLVGDAVPGAWRLWRAVLDLPPGEHELAVRAWDSAGGTQPEAAAAVWNFKGYANNAWHRVRVTAR